MSDEKKGAVLTGEELARLPSEIELAEFLLAVRSYLSPAGVMTGRRVCAAASLARLAAELFREHGEAIWLASTHSNSHETIKALESTIAAFRKGAE